MAFVKYDDVEIGAKVTTTIKHSNFEGYMEVGTEVTVIGISSRGYDIEDAEGNQVLEIGWKI